MTTSIPSCQERLATEVALSEICTGCGGCVNLCPHNAAHKDRIVFVDKCDRETGRCYSYCPRTPVDAEALRESLFPGAKLIPELGAVRELYTCRASDQLVRRGAQHGGTVSALIALALEEGIIDHAVLAQGEADLLPKPVGVEQTKEVARRAKSQFVVSPTLASVNQMSKAGMTKLGVVATPCQALALAKMRAGLYPPDSGQESPIKLVIGLFCGWALSWRELSKVLAKHVGDRAIDKLDIPPSQHSCMHVYCGDDLIEIPLEEITPCVRPSCDYCADMTAEFADLSVGSARLPGGWDEAMGWNQVLTRSEQGQQLMDLALERGVLETQRTPPENLPKLQRASEAKKQKALTNLIKLSGDKANLIYLDDKDPAIASLLTRFFE